MAPSRCSLNTPRCTARASKWRPTTPPTVHGLGPWTVGGVVGLHLLALAVHRGVFKEHLLGAMVSGRRPEHTGEDIQRRPLLGGGLMVLAAGVVWAVLNYLP